MGSYSRLPHLWRSPNGYLYIVHSDRGLWRRKSTKTKKMAAAQAQLQAFLEGGCARRASAPRLSLAEHLVEWLEDRAAEHVGLSLKSVRAYQLTAKRLTEAPIGKLRSDEIEAQDVRDFLKRLRAQQVPPSALARELLHLRMIFRWLRRREYVRDNPAEIVEAPKVARGRRPAVTPEQFVALRAAAAGDLDAAETETDRREAQLLVDLLDVLWLSGLRSIEAVRLQWRDVDLDARTWRIRSPANKGGDQVLPLHPELVVGTVGNLAASEGGALME